MSEIFFFICIKSFKLQGAHKGCKGTAKQLAYYVEMTSHLYALVYMFCWCILCNIPAQAYSFPSTIRDQGIMLDSQGRVFDNTHMAIFMSKKMPKTSTVLGVIIVSNELHPNFQVWMKLYVLFLDSNGNTVDSPFLLKTMSLTLHILRIFI